MPIVQRQAMVLHSAENMYALVQDVKSYENFLPWCEKSEVLEDKLSSVTGRLTLNWHGLHKSFTTKNQLHPHKLIEIRLVEGPFSHLEGFWQFEALTLQASKVHLSLEFEFNNKIIDFAFGKVFEQVASSLVDAFCKRANDVYRHPPLRA